MIDEESVWQQLKTVEDPDVHVNIVDLGLVYSVAINNAAQSVHVTMTLTSPSCPMGEVIFSSVRDVVSSILPEYNVDVELVWDPPWNSDMITDFGKMELGLL